MKTDSKERHRLVAKRWAQEHKGKKAMYLLEYRRQIKARVLAHYSDSDIPHCLFCGITDIDVLCLDHIDNDALARGHRHKGGANFYFRLEQSSYPDGYQTLCANCNLKKELIRRRGCVSS